MSRPSVETVAAQIGEKCKCAWIMDLTNAVPFRLKDSTLGESPLPDLTTKRAD